MRQTSERLRAARDDRRGVAGKRHRRRRAVHRSGAVIERGAGAGMSGMREHDDDFVRWRTLEEEVTDMATNRISRVSHHGRLRGRAQRIRDRAAAHAQWFDETYPGFFRCKARTPPGDDASAAACQRQIRRAAGRRAGRAKHHSVHRWLSDARPATNFGSATASRVRWRRAAAVFRDSTSAAFRAAPISHSSRGRICTYRAGTTWPTATPS